MFALCVESSHSRGMGHLFRALVLADALTACGHAVTFLLNDHAPSQQIARERGYNPITVDVADTISNWETTFIAQHNIKLWVNDRLDTQTAHATRVKAAGIPLVTFDDPGPGAALADLHIVALNALREAAPAGKTVLRGVEYLILNPAIAHHRRHRTRADSILVTLGGSDTYGVTVRVVEALAALNKTATVILGPAFTHHAALDAVLTPAFTVKRGVPAMAAEMAQHDLAITNGGITPFEASAAGLPCIIIANEHFEIPNGQLLESLGCSVFAGYHAALDVSHFARDLPIAAMSQAGIARVSLDGTAKIIRALEQLR